MIKSDAEWINRMIKDTDTHSVTGHDADAKNEATNSNNTRDDTNMGEGDNEMDKRWVNSITSDLSTTRNSDTDTETDGTDPNSTRNEVTSSNSTRDDTNMGDDGKKMSRRWLTSITDDIGTTRTSDTDDETDGTDPNSTNNDTNTETNPVQRIFPPWPPAR